MTLPIYCSNLEKTLKIDNNSKDETISDFLLDICNIKNKKIRKNAKGVTQKLYFGALKRLFLVNEKKVITEKSPFLGGQNTQKTADKNVLKFILTEEDDSDIVILLTKDEELIAKSKLELYEEITFDLSSVRNDLNENMYDDVESKIQKLDEEIENFKSFYGVSYEEFKQYDNEKNNLHEKILNYESQLINIDEILKRSKILESQYYSDIERLNSSKEVGDTFSLFSISKCPICDSDVSTSSIVNYQEFISASVNEIEKINLLLNELRESKKIFKHEKESLFKLLDEEKIKYDNLLKVIENTFTIKLDELSLKIENFSKERDELIKVRVLKEKLNEYVIKQESIQNILEINEDKDTDYQELSVELFVDITTLMKTILLTLR